METLTESNVLERDTIVRAAQTGWYRRVGARLIETIAHRSTVSGPSV
jgi:hypothetical protein